MTGRRFFTTFALASAVALSAAASANEARAQDTGATERKATVYVENHHTSDIRVYAVSGGRTQRLGLVTSFTTSQFKLPAWFVGGGHEFRLVAYPIGARTGVATQDLDAFPGDVVEWQVRNALGLSSASVYRGP
jgi:hypothetical protein